MNHLRAQWRRRIANVSDYGGQHQPADDGPTADDLLGPDSFAPPDVYENFRFYTGFEDMVRSEVMPVLRKVRGNPDARVVIYRALPPGHTNIESGNWISLSLAYAREHAIQDDDEGNDWPVIAAEVPARTVRWAGDDLIEWGYFGPAVQARVV